MDQISTAITNVVAVSVAVERVLEILKQMFPRLATELADPAREGWRHATVQVLAAAVGTGIAQYGSLQLGSHNNISTHVVLGLLASGGSAFWGHALGAMRAVKVNKEAEANQQATISRQLTMRAAG